MVRPRHPMLSLRDDDPERLVFAFSSRGWAALTGTFAVGCGALLWFMGPELRATSEPAYWFVWLLAWAFVVSTLYSLATHRSLVIDRPAREVRYRAQSPLGRREWTRAFSEFRRVRLYRPGGDAGRTAFLQVLLETIHGEEIPLGTSVFGVLGRSEARQLGERVAQSMSLSVVEDAAPDGVG